MNRRVLAPLVLGAAFLLVLVLTHMASFLLFHSLAELFSVAVAWATFLMAWHTRRYADNHAVLLLGGGPAFRRRHRPLAHPGLQGHGCFPGVRFRPDHAALDRGALPAEPVVSGRAAVSRPQAAGLAAPGRLRRAHPAPPRGRLQRAFPGLLRGGRGAHGLQARQRVRHLRPVRAFRSVLLPPPPAPAASGAGFAAHGHRPVRGRGAGLHLLCRGLRRLQRRRPFLQGRGFFISSTGPWSRAASSGPTICSSAS